MNRREFLKTTGSMTAGAMLTPEIQGQKTPALGSSYRTNWSGTYRFKAPHVERPVGVDDLQKAVTISQQAKALGSGHSFNDIADSSDTQIETLTVRGMSLDKAAHTVTVEAGVKYGMFAPWLDNQGFAVHNLASLPHVTVAGACATGTHGSGILNGNLATAVVAMDVIDGRGQMRTLSRAATPDVFPGAVVALGALGVVARTTLRAIPRFSVAQVVYENLPFDQLAQHFDAIMGSGYSVSLFTNWTEHRAQQVWLKQLPGPGTPQPGHYPAMFYSATLQKTKLHPVPGHDTTPCTDQFGQPGAWFDRLPHFKMNFKPSSGNEIQSEYFVPRKHAYEAILAVEKLREKITPHLLITELRCVAADDLWMSMAYQQDSLAIHFTWKPEAAAVNALTPQIEAALKPFQPRPHWAKVHSVSAQALKAAYPKYDDFKRLVKQFDPNGRFQNAYLERVLGA